MKYVPNYDESDNQQLDTTDMPDLESEEPAEQKKNKEDMD